jgi:hypothetical protein
VFRWGLEKITFSGGQEIPLDFGSVLILIGPNSSGKSRALLEIEQALASPGTHRVVVEAVNCLREGTPEAFTQWLKDNYPSRLESDGNLYFRTKGAVLPADGVERAWRGGDTLQGAQPFLTHRLGTQERLRISDRVGSIDPYHEPPHAYIHVLQASDDLMRRVSEEVRSAFDTDIIINWGAGPEVGFHVGQEPRRDADRHPVSQAYLDELNGLPRLDAEGDGIRSFVGGLLSALCGAHPVLMTDEPEAFLHPPQARRLAAALARTAAAQQRQLIIATHSADVVVGALEESDRVSVCRLTREQTDAGDINNASLLDSAHLRKLWSRPLLRSSAALDGLFHEGVVVCESDADCRFYEAILRRMEVLGLIGRAADLYFVHGGGKAQLATLARAYRSLDMRTAVIADIDLLRIRKEIADVAEALGADLTEVDSLYNSVYSALSDRAPVTSLKDSASGVRAILDEAQKAGSLSGEKRRKIVQLLDNADSWSEAKRYGFTKPRGGKSKDANDLQERLAAAGLFLVPIGELECWWREGPAEKAEWAVEAIRKVTEDPHSMAEATAFVTKPCRWFGYQID